MEHGVHGAQPADSGGQQRRQRHGGHRQARPAGTGGGLGTAEVLACGLAADHPAADGLAVNTPRKPACATQEVSQRYQRGELAESASTLLATGADLGLKGLSNLKGLLKTAVSQIDSYAGSPALGGDGASG